MAYQYEYLTNLEKIVVLENRIRSLEETIYSESLSVQIESASEPVDSEYINTINQRIQKYILAIEMLNTEKTLLQ
jgi:hypothetical protein